MSLQVWLPLRGDITNIGLDSDYNAPIANKSYPIFADDGKIGSQSLNPTTTTSGVLSYAKTLSNAHSYSMCAWVKSTNNSVSTSRYIMWTGNDNNSYGFGIRYYNSSGNAQCNAFGSTITLQIGYNEWHHVAMTMDYEKLKVSGYLDGVLVETKTYTPLTIPDYGFNIGWLRPSYYPFLGLINDVRLYDHCLSKREVKEIAKGLVLHYQLDDPEIMLSKCSNVTWNQLINPNNFPASISQNGVTGVVDKENGSITLNGDCTAYNVISIGHSAVSVTSGHKYVFKGCPIGGDYVGSTSGTYDYRINANGSYLTEIGNGLLWTATYTGTMNVYIRVAQGYSCNDLVFYPKLFDLTLMFGAGNEPTLEEFLEMFPDYIYKYDAGTVKNLSSQIPDSSGYLNNGTITGVLQLNEGSPRYGKCTLFSSSATNYIRIPNASLAGPYSSKELTFSFWINTQQTGNRHMIFGIVGSYNLNIELSTTNSLRVYWAGTPDLYPGITCTANTWVHVCVIVTSTYIKCYKNGVLIGTNTTTPNWAGCTQDLLIGTDQRIGTYFLGSKLSDFRIYATALSADDIKELYDTAAYIHNTGNLSGYEINESAHNLLQYENTLLYTNEANTASTRGKYVERNGAIAMAFKPTDTYFGSSDSRNNKLLYGLFKENTQYMFDLWMDVDDCVYTSDGLNKYGGFYIYYTDGTNYNGYVIKGADANEDPYGWQHKVYISTAGKTIRSMGIYYWGNWVFHVRADSCIVELSETGIKKNGTINSGQFIEDTDVAFIGKATFNSNNIIEI